MHLQNNALFYLGSSGLVLGLFVAIWGTGFVGVARICLGGKGLGKGPGQRAGNVRKVLKRRTFLDPVAMISAASH